MFYYGLNLKIKKNYQRPKLENPKYGKRLNFADWSIKLADFPNKFVIVVDVAYFYLAFPLKIKNETTIVLITLIFRNKKIFK